MSEYAHEGLEQSQTPQTLSPEFFLTFYILYVSYLTFKATKGSCFNWGDLLGSIYTALEVVASQMHENPMLFGGGIKTKAKRCRKKNNQWFTKSVGRQSGLLHLLWNLTSLLAVEVCWEWKFHTRWRVRGCRPWFGNKLVTETKNVPHIWWPMEPRGGLNCANLSSTWDVFLNVLGVLLHPMLNLLYICSYIFEPLLILLLCSCTYLFLHIEADLWTPDFFFPPLLDPLVYNTTHSVPWGRGHNFFFPVLFVLKTRIFTNESLM